MSLITVKFDQSVYDALAEFVSTNYPLKPNQKRKTNTVKILQKAEKAWEKALTEASLIGSERYAGPIESAWWWSVSLKKIEIASGQFGPDCIRIHSWLANHCPIYDELESGSNLTGKTSKITFKKNRVRITDNAMSRPAVLKEVEEIPEQEADVDANDLIRTEQLYIDSLVAKKDSAEIFESIFPEFDTLTEAELLEQYDITPISVPGIRAFLQWIETKEARKFNPYYKESAESKDKKAKNKERVKRQAHIMIAIAQELYITKNEVTGEVITGNFIQKKKPSEFGRTYYHGISIQNIDKTLRNAALGGCYEYDIVSSVVAWRMGFADALIARLRKDYPDATVQNTLGTSLIYLEDKKSLLNLIRNEIFDKDSFKRTPEAQTKALKGAFTALTFGATAKESGWKLEDGTWENPAIRDAFGDKETTARFFANESVISFMDEQALISKFIFDKAVAENPELLNNKALLKKNSKKLNMPKVLAYLYQHGETEVMNIAREVARERGHKVVANIHDAVFFERKLGETLGYVIQAMRERTGNRYWNLESKEIKPWLLAENQAAIAAHEKAIREEELLAHRVFVEAGLETDEFASNKTRSTAKVRQANAKDREDFFSGHYSAPVYEADEEELPQDAPDIYRNILSER